MPVQQHARLDRFTPPQWRVLNALHVAGHARNASSYVSLRTVLSKQDATKDDLLVLAADDLIGAFSAADGEPVALDRVDWDMVLGTRRVLIRLRITNRGNDTVWGQPEMMIAGSVHRGRPGHPHRYEATEVAKCAGLTAGDFKEVLAQMVEKNLADLLDHGGSEVPLRRLHELRTVPRGYRVRLTRKCTAYLERWR